MIGFGSWMDHDSSITTKEKKKQIISSVHPSTGPPDLNLVLTEMDSPLVNKLMCCAKAVADGDLKLADVFFEEMEPLTTSETNEVTKTVAKYFAEALVRRVHGLHPPNPMPLLPSIEMHNYPYTQEIPFHLFATIATKYNMLQTLITERSKQIHFIDFSMVVSYRYWRDWFFYYGMRVQGSQSFRVTSIRPKLSRYDDHLQPHTCQQIITPLASQCDIDFQCEEVFANSAAEIVEAVLNIKRTSEDETIIVRWVFELHKLLAQEGAIEKVLSKLKDLRPDIMVIVEQEANHNSSDFFNRFMSSFDYYHSVFEASEQYDADPRVKLLLEMHLRRQISNVVASEGIDRFERHETFDRWQERLSQAGFNSIPLRSNELENRSLHPMSEFIIVENNGFPMLRFFNRPLAVVSVWKPVNPTQFNDVDRGNVGNSDSLLLRGGDLNYPIAIQDTDHATLPFETEAASSSDSEDDIGCHPDTMTNRRIWSEEGFRKVDPDHLEFANEGFLRGQKHLLRTISRRKPANGDDNQQPQQPRGQNSSVGAYVEVGKFGLEEEVERLKRAKNVLMQELVRLKQPQESAVSQLQIMAQRLQGMEQRQQQMVTFLEKRGMMTWASELERKKGVPWTWTEKT